MDTCIDSNDIIMEEEKPTKAPKERTGWQGTMDFILTCIGYAVGLGNIWRFPYLCYKSGGGAFFIPYVIFLTLCGIPLFFLEAVYGQFASLSPITVWRMSPLFKGVGVGMVIVSALVCVYYNVIVAWTVYYLFMSLRAVLPWSKCGNWWNTNSCVGTETSVILATMNGSIGFNVSDTGNGSISASFPQIIRPIDTVSSSEEFWERHVLQLSSGIEEPGALRWELVLTLAVAWLLVFLCLFKGVAVLGKIMHFCAPFPYLVLLVLLVRGVTLEGATKGIKFYIIPRWEKLATFQVWGDAALQIFYSVGMGWGGVVTMASYNNFKHNIYRDALIVPIINCCTSVFAGFVIFSILGFMAHQTGKSVEEVVKQGPGLTFVAYPEAVSLLPISPLWSVLFFLMLLVIGIDSQFGMLETCLSAFLDEFPKQLRRRRTLVAAIVCVIEFILGLPLVTQGGIYVLQIIDWYCASFSLMVISFSECVAISWVYGVDRYYKDIELMIGYQPPRIWSYLWRFITPTIITFIWLFSIITLGPVTYGDVTYPKWAVTFGWCLGAIALIPLPACAIYQILKEEGSLLQKNIIRVANSWDPDETRLIWIQTVCSRSHKFSRSMHNVNISAGIDLLSLNILIGVLISLDPDQTPSYLPMARIKKLSRPSTSWGPREQKYRDIYLMSLEKSRNIEGKEMQTIIDRSDEEEETFKTDNGYERIHNNDDHNWIK